MDKKKTDKEKLAKGVQILAMSLGAIALGPIVLYNAFMNKEHPFFWVVASVGVLLMFLAIFLILRGIKFMLDSFFN